MNVALFGKIMGWVQFALQLVGQVGAAGMPTTWQQWVASIGSLAVAVGVHAASSTDGAK